MIDFNNPKGYKTETKPATRYNILFFSVIAIWAIWIFSAFADSKTELQKCQESYMKAQNELFRYNEDNPEYKVWVPLYNCWTASGAIVPPPERPLEILHEKICKKQMHSPLCKDKALFYILNNITEERLPWKNWFPILIGMTNAESSLWIDFAKDKVWGTCYGRNNLWWAKYMIKDDNTRVYKRSINWFDYKYPRDQYDCNLFPFESIEEYWISKVNGIRYWYKWCIDSKTPVKCISYQYVWSPKVSEQSWVDNVSQFLN